MSLWTWKDKRAEVLRRKKQAEEAKEKEREKEEAQMNSLYSQAQLQAMSGMQQASNAGMQAAQYPYYTGTTITTSTAAIPSSYTIPNNIGGSISALQIYPYPPNHLTPSIHGHTLEFIIDMIVARTTAINLDIVRQIVREELDRKSDER